MSLPQEQDYTIEYIYSLPEVERAELINGQIYSMSPPSMIHQKIVTRLSAVIGSYIHKKHGSCESFVAPFAVFLNADDKNYVEPDISVICDKLKLDDKGCNGAPDWIIEVVSPSSERIDYGIKLFKYRSAGVREYWIVNPQKSTVTVFDFEKDQYSGQYIFTDDIPVCIYDNLIINISNLI